jgi:ABC-type multidrug transport system fused ATPase/permease subunit
MQRALEPQQFFIFLFAMLQLMSPLKSLSNVNATLQEGLAAAVRIFRILDTQPAIVSRPNSRLVSGIRSGIDFEGVSFRYGNGPEVLRDVSFWLRWWDRAAPGSRPWWIWSRASTTRPRAGSSSTDTTSGITTWVPCGG